jgi:hypothetical protein
LLLNFSHNDGELRERLLDPAHASAGPRVKPLHHKIFAHESFGDDQLIDIETVVVLCIRNRRLQRLFHILGDTLVRKGEIGQSLLTFLPRISWATRLSFCGLTRKLRATA